MVLLSLTLARSGTHQSTFIKAEEGPSSYHPVTHTLDGGLSHTTSPTRADKKIEDGKFVEMADLVPSHLGFEEITGSKPRQPSVTNISEWLQAFAVYMSVISKKQPQHVPDLTGYQILMLEVSNEY